MQIKQNKNIKIPFKYNFKIQPKFKTICRKLKPIDFLEYLYYKLI